MRFPDYVSERQSSWREIAATWIIAALLLGLVSLTGSVFGYRSQHVAEAGSPVLTNVAEADFGRKQHRDDQVYRVSGQVAAPVNAR